MHGLRPTGRSVAALLLVGVVSAGAGACADAADVEPAASPGTASPSPSATASDTPSASPTSTEASPTATADDEARAAEILRDLGAENGSEGAVVSFDAADLFDADSIELTSDGKDRLDVLLEALGLLDDAPIQIHGHADTGAAGEDAEVFAHQRAASVAVYVVEEGINKDRLSVDGIGPSDSQRVDVTLSTVGLDATDSS